MGFASSNGGVFTAREAMALGMSHDVLGRRIEDGIFVRIARGVYALPGASTRADLLMRAACRSLGAVVSHESAAIVHNMKPVAALLVASIFRSSSSLIPIHASPPMILPAR